MLAKVSRTASAHGPVRRMRIDFTSRLSGSVRLWGSMTNARKLAKQHKKARARKAKATTVRAQKIVAKKVAREAEKAASPEDGADPSPAEPPRQAGSTGWTRTGRNAAGPPKSKVHRTQGT